MQACTFTGSTGTCVEIASDPSTQQTCTFDQGPPAPTNPRANVAIVVQIIVQRNASPTAGAQNGRQLTDVMQRNSLKPNLSFVTQIIKQSLGRGAGDTDNEINDEQKAESAGESQSALPDFSTLVSNLNTWEPTTEGDESPVSMTSPPTDVLQEQFSQQTLHVCQGGPTDCNIAAGMTSTNLSSVYQSLKQRERWAKTTPTGTITQHQNLPGGDCQTSSGLSNMCAIVKQNADATGGAGGKNVSGLVELYRQFQSAGDTGHADQRQDKPFEFSDDSALDHDINQLALNADPTGAKRNTILTSQFGRQVQRVARVGSSFQFQDPVGRKGRLSAQLGTTNDIWLGNQVMKQLQTVDGAFTPLTAGTQFQELTYDGEATGTIHARQLGVENGSAATNSCDSSSCHIEIDCAGGNFGEGGTAPALCAPPSDIGFARRG